MELLRGRYELHERIGEGGMATVHRAWDRVLRAARAIKRLKPGARRNARYRSRFASEAQAMASIDHPNIVRVYDYGDDAEATFMVMALAEGGSVGSLLDARGAYPVDGAVRLTLDVLAALSAAHAAGVIHRDVKPMNILLDGQGRALVTDFGIARLEREDADGIRHTRAGVSLGTFAYMAPEQRTDARTVTRAADVYAAAATLFELVTSETPIDLFAVREDSPRWATVPDALRPALQRALAYLPEDRFQEAAAFAAALEEVLPELPTTPVAGSRSRAHADVSDGATLTVELSVPHASTVPLVPATPSARLDDLSAWYRRSLADKAEQLREAATAHVEGVPGAITRLRRLAHALRGSGGTFGYPSVSQAAAEVEDAPLDEIVGRSTALIYVLRHLSEPHTTLDLPVVLVATGDPDTERALDAALRQPRQAVRVLRDAESTRRALKQEMPAVIVLDLALPGLDIARLSTRPPRATHEVPVVVLGPDDRAARAWALASGAVSYHARPLDLVSVAAAVESARRRHDDHTIDPLTRLPDRAAFRLVALRAEHTHDTAAAWTLGAIAWTDAADTASEAVRDAVVVEVARRVRGALPPDLHLARWDGAVFTWLAPEETPEAAAAWVRAALDAASQPVVVGEVTVTPALAASAVAGRSGALGALLVQVLDAATEPGVVRLCQTEEPSHEGRVLVCDDDPSVTRMVAEIAHGAGLEAQVVGTGAAALEALGRTRFDLLVLDVELPDTDGFEVLRTLRADDATSDLHVMMLTAKGREPHQVLGLELGADDYVAKPFDPAVLQARMRRLVQRARRSRA
ncbi:MAG: response regulator [Alphaproteobacteria bacterium]|nr:response regulator [Alphaproteobacteria bacterium]